jgi:hypothetical protein
VRLCNSHTAAARAFALSPPTRSLDTTQVVNNYMGIVLYAIVVATCIITFLQGARMHAR